MTVFRVCLRCNKRQKTRERPYSFSDCCEQHNIPVKLLFVLFLVPSLFVFNYIKKWPFFFHHSKLKNNSTTQHTAHAASRLLQSQQQHSALSKLSACGDQKNIDYSSISTSPQFHFAQKGQLQPKCKIRSNKWSRTTFILNKSH